MNPLVAPEQRDGAGNKGGRRHLNRSAEEKRAMKSAAGKRFYKKNKQKVNLKRRLRYRKDPETVALKRQRLAQLKTLPDENRYRRWTKEEDILAMDASVTVVDLALKLGRTLRAVASRRYHMRKAGEQEVKTQTPEETSQ